MPLWPNFIGQSYRTQSATIAADACLNLYLETTRNAADPKKATFYGTPGMNVIAADPAYDGCRGLFSQDGRIFAVNGPTFFEFTPSLPPFHFATVANDNRKVTFASNGLGGNQLAICSAGALYIFNLATNVMTGPIVLPGGFIPVMVGYMDGYFLLNEKDTPKIWFSNLFNGLTWSATDFFTRSSTSDNVTGFAVNNRRVYVIGSKSTEIFQNSGDPTTPFIPYPGTVINEGSRGYANIASIADTVFWIGSSLEYGYSQIFAVSGLQPKLISTPPISASIGGNADSAAEALAYSQGGHDFVCWTFPFIKTTWCYDLTEEAWHARAKVVESPPGVYTQSIWPARGCCTWLPILGEPFARVIVGHWFDGVFADLSLDTYTEPASATTGDIYPIFRQRVAPYLSAENQWLFLQQMELGINAQAGALPSPDVQLRLSGDNGTSFGPPMPASALAQDGQAVAQWFQLGRYRADRLVIAVQSQVDRPTVWGPGLFLRATPGTGQL